MRKPTTIFALLALAGLPGSAQTTSGSITGSVVDAQHSVVPNAAVTAAEQERKFNFSTKTDESGRFVFPMVLAGARDSVGDSPTQKKL